MPHRKSSLIDNLLFLEKILLFLFTFFLVIYLIIVFTDFSEQFKNYLFFSGNFADYIGIVVLFAIISYVLRKLLIWQYRLEFKRK
ncbi:MAG TPA: hypothetical protein VJK05_01095 [archaeon]|nr:hypothetical protein [archaeon]